MNNSSNKIKENKYKILRMSLLLGNGEDREETVNNFEDAAREIDAMNDEVYLKNLDSKFYDTLTLEEEEKKLVSLVDYVGGRVEQRESLISDFANVTGFELRNLPIIKYQDRLDEYKSRLGYIKEYLSNTERINKLNVEISDYETKLNEAYVKKSKAEDANVNLEKELLNKFNIIVGGIPSFKDLDASNVSSRLDEIVQLTEESKKSLDIFNKSFATLDQVGISDKERDEYLSYVNGAKEAYYSNKEEEYLLKMYSILSNCESEYSNILAKRNSLNELIYERTSLRKELGVKGNDILGSIYDLLDRQYNEIKNQGTNIENIDIYIAEIDSRRSEVNSLEQDNQKVEILSLLREFCLIDTYDDIAHDSKELSNENNNALGDISLDTYNKNLNIETVNNDTVEEVVTDNNGDDNINIDNSSDVKSGDSDSFSDVLNEISFDDGVSDNSLVKDNQVVSIEDASKMDVSLAASKSNSVMKRVGDMLGVKIDASEVSNDEKVGTSVNDASSQDNVEEDVVNSEESDVLKKDDDVISDNLFEDNNFDADPEIDTNVNSQSSFNENPLFNNDLANTTIDEVMANNKKQVDEVNDFWDVSDGVAMDLNSLPDLDISKNKEFEDNNSNSMPTLDFPDLDGTGFMEEEK